MINEQLNPRYSEVLLLIIVFLFSGNPSVMLVDQRVDGVILLLFCALFCSVRGGMQMPLLLQAVIFSLIYIIIGALQHFYYGDGYWVALLGHVVHCLTGSLVACYCGKRFPLSYILALSVIIAVSLIFYIPALVAYLIESDFKEIFRPFSSGLEGYFHIYIYNFNQTSTVYENYDWSWRNSAMFWEPGALSGYSCLGLILLNELKGYLKSGLFTIFGVLLVAGVVTSCSTAGYLLLPLIYIFFYRNKTSSIFVSWAIFGLIAFAALVLQLPFVANKLQVEWTQVLEQSENFGVSRLGGFVFDWPYIAERPLIGWGANQYARLNDDPALDKVLAIQGNGLTSYTVRFGIIGLMVLILSAYFSGKRYFSFSGASRALPFSLFMLLICVGEQFLNYALIFSFLSLSSIKKKSFQRKV